MLTRYSADEKGRLAKKALVYTQQEHHLTPDSLDKDALFIIDKLKRHGFDAFVVGGAVRDLLVGHVPKDFDIVTDATPPKIKKLFKNSRVIGKRFRLVHVIFGQKIFEVSTFRSIAEGTIGNVFGTMDEDALRRDFSFNALYYDPEKNQVIDYVGGVADIKRRLVRPVIPLDHIFAEDPVRMIRAVKYAACMGFRLPHKVKKRIVSQAKLLQGISPSRITEELLKIVNSSRSFAIVSMALKTNVFAYLQPAACKLMEEDKSFKASYLANLQAMDSLVRTDPASRLGERLFFLIKDFMEHISDWKQQAQSRSPSEIYKRAWEVCRGFVLPMNPQRVELDFAVKKELALLGIKVKPRRTSTRKSSPRTTDQDTPPSTS